jgi:hypothetical protein
MRLKTTPQYTPPATAYSTTATPSVATHAVAQKAVPMAVTKRLVKAIPARVLLWGTFLTPLVLVGSYLTRPVPYVALAPRTEIVSQNGQIFARRILRSDGVSQLVVGRVGEKPLWTEAFPKEGAVVLSPNERYIVTWAARFETDPVQSFYPSYTEYTFQCRDTVTRAEVWKRWGPASATTMPVGPNAVAVSPDGAHVAMVVEEGIRICSLQSGAFERFVSTLPKTLDPDVQLSYSPDGQRIIAAQGRGIEHWDISLRK